MNRDLRSKSEPVFSAPCSTCSVHGVRRLPETHLAHPPRMADFAVWSVACGLDGFEGAYQANRPECNQHYPRA